jgi:hypothetical protein
VLQWREWDDEQDQNEIIQNPILNDSNNVSIIDLTDDNDYIQTIDPINNYSNQIKTENDEIEIQISPSTSFSNVQDQINKIQTTITNPINDTLPLESSDDDDNDNVINNNEKIEETNGDQTANALFNLFDDSPIKVAKQSHKSIKIPMKLVNKPKISINKRKIDVDKILQNNKKLRLQNEIDTENESAMSILRDRVMLEEIDKLSSMIDNDSNQE